jgi:glutathione S-transferase
MTPAVLYRCRTPTDRLCPCGRVARELAKRGIEAEQRQVQWRRRDRDEIEELTGQRAVPVLVVGGEAICDSRRILEHLEWQRATSVDSGTSPRR